MPWKLAVCLFFELLLIMNIIIDKLDAGSTMSCSSKEVNARCFL